LQKIDTLLTVFTSMGIALEDGEEFDQEALVDKVILHQTVRQSLYNRPADSIITYLDYEHP
jgi:hypothetical protein